ncbi:MAG: prephenate dehydrogenase/arogenate dehydrogenase family protein [Phycisphaeraceae bacterium]|nr:prephenate dehydrogenase/arogenate dehydrogenase family protein [Phycisphaeraceae bacterium]
MDQREEQFGSIRQVAIIGVGLLGGSIGLGLKQAGFSGTILGLGRRIETLEKARQRGCVDDITADINRAVSDSQLIILCSPVATFGDWMDKIAAAIHPNLVITDVGSTKQVVCREAALRLARHASRFVGSHPMAGGERGGPEHATANLFQHRPCVITPVADTNPDALETVRQLWSRLGMRLITMSPADHDWTVARISHLPHAAAVALVAIASRQGGMQAASTGFGDTTRVASGDPEIWRDIFATNREAIVKAIDAYQLELGRLRDWIATGNDRDLLTALVEAKHARDQWLKTHGSAQAADQPAE